ncbi:MAG: endonuclease domain-containing protein [Alphaproteobacteria bacterium]|nr:MAG: hypothetical protein B6I23_01465 [Rickettsiaceae bacterium 4572_127]
MKQQIAKHFYNKKTLKNAQELRKKLTEAEELIWSFLRKKQLLNYKFRRQIPIRNYIVDFVCFEKKLIVELDGGQHCEEKNKNYDKRRAEVLEKSGFKVLRFWNNEIFDNLKGVLETIYLELKSDPAPK